MLHVRATRTNISYPETEVRVQMLLAELIFVLAIFVIALVSPELGDAWFRSVESRFRKIARRRWLAVCVVGLIALVVSMALTLLVHFPQPATHDEFAYLLGSDTFSQGRLTNPTHPMWEHFESYHIIQRPTYQMKFPPGQSLALVAGQLLGHPIIGVWISWSLACAAVCWMLQAWVPPRWALLAAVLPLLNAGLIEWWSQSYWGGAMPMLGGALLFGALPRLLRRPTVSSAVWLACGLAILANTRPYEGLVASVPAAMVLGISGLARQSWPLRRWLLQVAMPAGCVLLLAASWMGYYHYRVTGDPFRMPYQVWEATYLRQGTLATTLLQSSAATDDGTVLSQLLTSGESEQPKYRSMVPVIPNSILYRLVRQWKFYLRPILTIPVAFLFLVIRRPWMRFAVLTVLLVLLAIGFQNTFGNPHYAAPVFCLMLAVIVTGMRYLRCWKLNHRPVGRAMVRLMLLSLLVCLFWEMAAYSLEPVAAFQLWSNRRAAIKSQLESDGQRHLIVVRYADGHHIWHEWVYNDAEIDDAQVVWARELSPEKNRRLLRYFQDRKVWLLDADAQPQSLMPHVRPAN